MQIRAILDQTSAVPAQFIMHKFKGVGQGGNEGGEGFRWRERIGR